MFGQNYIDNFISNQLPLQDPVIILVLIFIIVLFAPAIFRKLKIPGIVGLIISGVLVGPYGLNLIARDTSINLFGTIGLLYLMFLVGLEIIMKDFRKNRVKSFVFGTYTFLIPLILGFLVSYVFLNYPVRHALLLSIIFSTHTLISYPIATRFGITKNRAVIVTIGGTIITDTAALIVLSIISASNKGNLDYWFWLVLFLKLLLFLIVMLAILPMVSKWFLKRLQEESGLQYVYILLVIFTSGFLAQLVGIEPIIGAFLAGLAMNRLIPQNSPLMNRTVFIGNSLFIPLFLIIVGMMIDLRVLFHGIDTLLLGLIFIAVGIISKFLAAWAAQRSFGYSGIERNVIWGLSSSRVAATLAIALVGFNMGMINESVLNSVILLIFVSTLISSFITENSARKLALASVSPETESQEIPERILIPISNPSTSKNLIDFAILIKDTKSREPVYPLHVTPDTGNYEENIRNFNKLIEPSIQYANSLEIQLFPVTRIELNPVQGIIRASRELIITKIVMGWHGRTSTSDYFFGSLLDNLINSYYKTVIVVKYGGIAQSMKNINVLVPDNAEYELGFVDWMKILNNLNAQTDASVRFIGSASVLGRINSAIEVLKLDMIPDFKIVKSWENPDYKNLDIKKDDLTIMIHARPRTISHHKHLDLIQKMLTSMPDDYNFAIIYPEQKDISSAFSSAYLENLSTTPFQENITRMNHFKNLLYRLIRRKNGKRKKIISG